MRSNTLVPSLLGLALLATAAFAGDLEDARALQQAGKFEEALPLYEQAAKADGAGADAALGLSEVLAGLGRYKDAAQAATRGLKTSKGHLGLLVARARAFLLMADKANAEGSDPQFIMATVADADISIKAALRTDPKSADARVLSAKVMRYQGGGGSDQSLALLDEVVADFPDHFDAHWDLGKHHMGQGAAKQKDAPAAAPHWAAAEKHFGRCAQIDPASGDAILQRTYAMAWARKPIGELAEGYEAALLLLVPDDKLLGQLYRSFSRDATGKAKRVSALRRVEAGFSDNALVLMYLAFAVNEESGAKEALAILDRAEKLAPTNPWIPLNRGDILLGSAGLKKALGAYHEALATMKGTPVKGVYDKLATLSVRSDKLSPKQRAALWNALWESWPENPDGPNNAGLWYRDVGRDAKQSSVWYVRAAAAAPDSAQIQNDTGLIFHYNLHDPETAEPYYRRAVTIGHEQRLNWDGTGGLENVGYRDALNNLGRLLIQSKRWKDLGKFVKDLVPEDHPSYGAWKKQAEQKG